MTVLAPGVDEARTGTTVRGSLRAAWPAASDIGSVRSLLRAEVAVVAVIVLGLVLHVTLISQLEHRVAQIGAFNRFRNELARGTAPTGGYDFNGRPVPIGSGVALLEIPRLHVHEVVVEGTTSEALETGPGHLRNTVSPGQVGTSVIYGRTGSYGAPFRNLPSLRKTDDVKITTSTGALTYRVIDVRRAGDPVPPNPGTNVGRLTLVGTTGPPFIPTGLLRVDADVADAAPATSPPVRTIGGRERALRGDTEGMWMLVLLLEAMIALEVSALWCWRRWGRAQTWIVFLPAALLVGYHAAEHIARMLPNLL